MHHSSDDTARVEALAGEVHVGGGLDALGVEYAVLGSAACSGKHKKHGMNVQVLTDPPPAFGREVPPGKLLRASPALPGAVHDVKAARTHGIPEALARMAVRCWADKAYQGAGPAVRVPCRGCWETLSAGQKAVSRAHAKIRAVGEQAMATLENWRLLRKLRCSTTRITDLVKAVLALELATSA